MLCYFGFVRNLGVFVNSFIFVCLFKYGFENKWIVVIVLLSSIIIKLFVSICYCVFSNVLLVLNNVIFINIVIDFFIICKSNILKMNRFN